MINYNNYLYKCIILAIRRKNSKYIYKVLKINYNFDENLLSTANDAKDYLLNQELKKLNI